MLELTSNTFTIPPEIMYGMQWFFWLAVGIAAVIALFNWRFGLLAMCVFASIQDPIRKLVPDAPGYFVLTTSPIWMAAIFSLAMERRDFWSNFVHHNPTIALATKLFIICLIPGFLLAATYGPGSILVGLVGLFTYVSVIMGLVFGFYVGDKEQYLRKVLGIYCISMSIVLSGTLIDYLGFSNISDAIGTEALGLVWVRYPAEGGVINLTSGFFRSPDIMGWHAVMVTIFASTLAATSKNSWRWFWLAIAIWSFAMALPCGRRKIVLLAPLFFVIWTCLNLYFGRYKDALVAVLIASAVVITGYIGFSQLGEQDDLDQYYLSSFAETNDRLEQHAIEAVDMTRQQWGLFGAGLGTANPGIRHLPVAKPRTWQEGGFGRLLVELGIIGIVGLVILMLAVGFKMTKVIFTQNTEPGANTAWAIVISSLIIANGASFVISAQIFSAPFVVSLLTTLIGVGLSLGVSQADKKTALPSNVHIIKPSQLG